MSTRTLPLLALLLALGIGAAQSGRWTVDSDFDLFSFLGLGSIWVEAQQHPADLAAADALLVVGCDPNAPAQVEIAAWAAPFGTIATGDGSPLDVDVLVRFDQGGILRQRWFLSEGYFQIEAVAYYELNEALLAGLRTASTMALRIVADPSRSIAERTFQYDVRGFADALGALRCGELEAEPDAPADPFADAATSDPFGGTDEVRVGDWVFDGDTGMLARSELGAVALYCADDANGVEIEVGDYGLSEPRYAVRFRSGNIDFLQATATLNDFGAAQLDGDAVEDRLVRFLRGVVDLTVTIEPASKVGAPQTYTVSTLGFNDALARLGCYAGGR